MFRKIIATVIILVNLLLPVAKTEKIEDRDFYCGQAVETVNLWISLIETMYEKSSQTSSVIFVRIEDLLQMAIDTVLSNEEQLNNGEKETIGNATGTRYGDSTLNMYYISDKVYFNDTGVFVSADISFRDEYCCIGLKMFDKNGAELADTRIYLGSREGTTLCLLVDYDNTNYTTGRFLVKTSVDENQDDEVVYTKTLGRTMDIVLNVEAWQLGRDYQWGQELLYPIDYLLNK